METTGTPDGSSVSGMLQTATWDPVLEQIKEMSLFFTVIYDEQGKAIQIDAGVGKGFVEAMSGPVTKFNYLEWAERECRILRG